MTLEEQIKILESNAEFERKDGDLQGCLNFRQLVEWLKDYKRLLGAIDAIKAEIEVPTHDMWVQYSIKGHTDKDIQDTVSDVIKQSKKQVLAIIDRHISGGDAE